MHKFITVALFLKKTCSVLIILSPVIQLFSFCIFDHFAVLVLNHCCTFKKKLASLSFHVYMHHVRLNVYVNKHFAVLFNFKFPALPTRQVYSYRIGPAIIPQSLNWPHVVLLVACLRKMPCTSCVGARHYTSVFHQFRLGT